MQSKAKRTQRVRKWRQRECGGARGEWHTHDKGAALIFVHFVQLAISSARAGEIPLIVAVALGTCFCCDCCCCYCFSVCCCCLYNALFNVVALHNSAAPEHTQKQKQKNEHN